MIQLIVDIETKPCKKYEEIACNNVKAHGGIKDPAKIEADIAKKKAVVVGGMALDHDMSEVFCIGVKHVDGDGSLMSLKVFSEYLNGMEDASMPYRIITYNGKGFDFPILMKCAVKEGLMLPFCTMMQGTKKYDTSVHVDLQEALNPYGKWKSKDMMAQIYLGITPKPIDFNTCTDDELREHCLEDLDVTEQLYKKFHGVFFL